MNQTLKAYLPLFLILCVVAFAVCFIDSSEAEEKSSSKSNHSRMSQIEKDLLEQQEALANIDIQEKSILEEIERLEKEVIIHKRSLKEVSDRIKEISCEIQRGQSRIRELNDSSCATKTYLKKRLVAFYKFGRSGYICLLVSSASLQEFQKTIKYMRIIMEQDRKVLDVLESQRKEIEDEVGRLKENREKVEGLKKTKESKTALLETYIERKIVLLMKIHKEKEFHAKAVKELKEATSALSETVMHLGTQKKKEILPQGFAQMKGKLPFPLHGTLLKDLKKFGFNPFMHRKGVYIKSSPGQTVRSVFPGRVDYSGWFKGYGQLLIIDHGGHYFTVFAHLDETIKQKGEMVSAGEAVGVVGDLGWKVGSGVYFEIRKAGNHLDPRQWLQ